MRHLHTLTSANTCAQVLSRVESLSSSFKDFELERSGSPPGSHPENVQPDTEAGTDIIDFVPVPEALSSTSGETRAGLQGLLACL